MSGYLEDNRNGVPLVILELTEYNLLGCAGREFSYKFAVYVYANITGCVFTGGVLIGLNTKTDGCEACTGRAFL